MIRISSNRIPVKKNRRIAFVIHYLLKIPYLILGFPICQMFRKKEDLELDRISKILVIQINGIGDIVMSTPTFRGIREVFRHARITLLAARPSKDIVEPMPYFDEIIYLNALWAIKGAKFAPVIDILRTLRRKSFDLAIDLRGDFRNIIFMYFCDAKHSLSYQASGCDFFLTDVVTPGEGEHSVEWGLRLLDYLGLKNASSELSLSIKDKDYHFAEQLWRENKFDSSSPVVIIHPGVRWYGRKWKSERYAEIADRLIDRYDAKVIFTGSPGEISCVNEVTQIMKNKPIIFAGKTTIRELAAIIAKSDLFIGVDSGPMHIATAVKTPVIALFGAGDPSFIGPYGRGHKVISKQNEFPCSPCAQTECKYPENMNCMAAITVNEVWEAVEEQFEKILGAKRQSNAEKKEVIP